MKKLTVIVISILSFTSCNRHCKEDSEFHEIYFKMLDTIASYDELFDTDEEIPTPLLWERSENIHNYEAYLEYLTQHEFRNIEVEHLPIYRNKSDFEADMKDLKKWHKENKCGMTIEKADSIVNASYERATGRKDSMWRNIEIPR